MALPSPAGEPPDPSPSQPRWPAPTALPTLSLVGEELQLHDANDAAVDAFRVDVGNFSASKWLCVRGDDPRAVLDRLVRASRAYRWGRQDPPVLRYDLPRSTKPTASAAAEVLVSARIAADEQTEYTITFLRPISTSPSDLEALGPVPSRHFASRVPHPVFAATPPESASPTPSPIPIAHGPPPVTAISPSSLNSLSESEASRSASFSSGHSVSSRRNHRPAVGPERRNLPLSPEATSMLAHATGLVTHPASRRESIDGGHTDSRQPSIDADQDSTLALEDKLPLSVSVLVGRTTSLDRGIEALSDGTDRGAGKPLPFRVPTRGERDADADAGAARDTTPSDGDGAQTPDAPQVFADDEELTNGATLPATESVPSSPAAPLNGSVAAAKRHTLTLHNLVDMIETVPMVSAWQRSGGVPAPGTHPSRPSRNRSCSWQTLMAELPGSTKPGTITPVPTLLST